LLIAFSFVNTGSDSSPTVAVSVAYPHIGEGSVKSLFSKSVRSVQGSILAGIITMGPLFVTWLIFSFLFRTLANAGLPIVHLFRTVFDADWLGNPFIASILAIVLTLAVLYAVGRVTSEVIGRQVFQLFESALERLPFVAKVYTSVRQLIDTMMAKKPSSQRVVLVDFPIEGQKCIGFLTRTLSDSETGEPLAAVLLPNAINPTSAFLQVLPISRVIETDMTMEQAMSMLLTGGAVGPDSVRYSAGPVAVQDTAEADAPKG
jgi:uncharacterized membrane protein